MDSRTDIIRKKEREIRNRNLRKKRIRRIFSICIAVVVIFATAGALVKPALTASATTYCGMEEHTHTLACFSNPEADVETADQWEVTLPEELAGTAAENLVAVAESQVGYKESDNNYQVAEDGKTKLGYTRYGAWVDEPYADWSLDFISFCLHYAGVKTVDVAEVSDITEEISDAADTIPVDNTSEEKWIEAVEKAGLVSDEYEVGSLVFMQSEEIDGAGTVPHAGIVTAVDENEFTVVEGDRDNAVVEKYYRKNSDQIVAVAMLPDATGDEDLEEAAPAEDTSTLDFKGSNYSVKATFAEGVFPDGTEMTVSEILGNGRKSKEYNNYLNQAEEAVGDEITSARFFDITFKAAGEEVEPDGDVNIVIFTEENVKGAGDSSVEGFVKAVHLPEGEEAEVIEATAEGNEISFTADSFSVYGVVYTVYLHFSTEGRDYTVNIEADMDAAIPENAELVVEEISKNTKQYEDYYQEAWESIQPEPDENVNLGMELLMPTVDISFVRFFDISFIVDGEKIEPAAPVKVSISYDHPLELDKNESAKVVHFADAGTEVLDSELTMNPDLTDSEKKNEINTFEFSQDSFSVSATLVKSDSSAIPDGKYIILMNSIGNEGSKWYALDNNGGKKDVTSAMSGESLVVDDDCQWLFEKDKQSNFWTTISNNGRYITLNNGQVTDSTFDSVVADGESSNNYLRVKIRAGEDPEVYLSWSNNFITHGSSAQSFYLAQVEDAVDVIDVTAEKRDYRTHYIITDHYGNADKDHTNNSVVRAEGYLAKDDETKTFIPDPYSTANYAGVTVTAGHDAVTIGNNGSVAITHNDNVHLVHIDYYYKDPQTEASTVTFNRNTDKYDTKTINGKKYYDLTDERVHTEKTASVATGGENDGRSFNLTLEAWNVDWNISTVGMVLDASGSMAWDGAPGHKMQVNSAGTYTPYTFLSPSEVNNILCIDYTDNSVAGYGDYKYFVYEAGNDVNEYAPLGYYAGKNHSGNYLTLDGTANTRFADQQNIKQGVAGWYYVNTGTANPYNTIGGSKQYLGINVNENGINENITVDNHTVNFYKGTTLWTGSDNKYRKDTDYNSGKANTPVQFYVDQDGYLNCFFFHSKKIFNSPVYAKTDSELIKTEMLQDAIGCFTGTLHSISPESAIGMTRFSRSNTTQSNGFDNDQLTLLNWTTDSEKVINALNLSYGSENKANGSKVDQRLTVYNYGLTGATSTQSGIKAFNTYLNGNSALTTWASQYAKNTGTNSNPKYEYDKYVIIFTDGKDTDQKDNNYKGLAKTEADALKAKGYTVITVLLVPADAMNSDGTIKDQAFKDAKNFLASLNGKPDGSSSWADEVFIANAADTNALKGQFVKIAEKVAKTLTDYTVRDYIDPRFQLVDENDKPISVGPHPELGFTLYYDSDRDMQYVEWTGQNIPTNLKQDSAAIADGKDVNISLWSQTIRVRAKDDFLGGNEVLSNANVEELNKVYPDGNPNDNNEKTSRTFPRTTVDPAVLDLSINNVEDTIYLGETIGSTEHNMLETAVANTVNSYWYYEYLTRYGNATNTDYISQLKQGKAVEIPYYYMPQEVTQAEFNAAVLNPNNKDAYMKDKIGTLKYEWVPCDASGNVIELDNAYNYKTTNTDDVHYKLKITYTPLPEKTGTDNRDTYVQSMIDIDSHSRPVKDPVGTTQQKKEEQGIATVHIVSGQIQVDKQINKEELLSYFETNETNTITFEFSLKRNYNDADETYPAGITTDYAKSGGYGGYTYPETIKVTIAKSDAENASADADGNITVQGTLVEKLPIGTYTLAENVNSAFELKSISAKTLTDHLMAKVTGGTSATVELGVEDSSAIGINAVADVESPYVTIPAVSKKYLYAQKAELIVLNGSKPQLVIIKVDSTDTNKKVGGAQFSLYAAEDFNESTKKPRDGASPVTATSNTTAGSTLGYAQMGGLVTGETYYLVEDEPPAGYDAPEYSYIKIVYDGTHVNYSADVASVITGTATVETNGGIKGFFIQVSNSPGVELPSTGASGTKAIHLIGLMLIASAGAGMVMWRKRKAV